MEPDTQDLLLLKKALQRLPFPVPPQGLDRRLLQHLLQQTRQVDARPARLQRWSLAAGAALLVLMLGAGGVLWRSDGATTDPDELAQVDMLSELSVGVL
ncbi:MAG: hypothetical protein ACK5NY_07170 [Burkholderiaceae bacterium]|jgi:hypothetical protein